LTSVPLSTKDARMKKLIAVCAFALVAAALPAFAQAPVVGSADPESLFTSPDPKLHANKQVVLHIMRDLLEAGHWKDAPKYLSPRYIQHNPAIQSGLESVMKFFGSRPESPIPARNAWRTKVVSVTAENDLVVVGIVRELDNPRQPGTKYTTTWFDMWRIQDGKADEHWDYGTIAPPPAAK
jgi:predicted SnoaL-like aldol condensation-catalyzing enzyme